MSEQPECWLHVQPTARKDHKCSECFGVIRKGETYHRISGVWEGTPETFKRCRVCHEIIEELDRDADIEDGVTMGNLIEFVSESGGRRDLLRRYVGNALARGAKLKQWIIERAKEDTPS